MQFTGTENYHPKYVMLPGYLLPDTKNRPKPFPYGFSDLTFPTSI